MGGVVHYGRNPKDNYLALLRQYVRYAGPEMLFVTSAWVDVDGVQFDLAAMEQKHWEEDGQAREAWNVEVLSEERYAQYRQIAQAKKATLYLEGSRGTKTWTLGNKYKAGLRQVLDAFETEVQLEQARGMGSPFRITWRKRALPL